uniref:Mothers against decapentaplegic homolog n=1 Tax=Parastrongyloides trichosuri TaxID=131310 RepID=A0A0N4Z647_PARTI
MKSFNAGPSSIQGLNTSKVKPMSSDTCSTIASFLMEFNVSDDIEFSRKAIESLIKKLKDNSCQLDELINSVSSKGQTKTKCITIPRTLDGRLQVAGRKGFPHVVYVKTFIYPDVSKNDLKHKEYCLNGFDDKTEQVCVNPYHYDKTCNILLGKKDERAPSNDSNISISYNSASVPSNDSTIISSSHLSPQMSNNNYVFSPPSTSYTITSPGFSPQQHLSTPCSNIIDGNFEPMSNTSTPTREEGQQFIPKLPIPNSNYIETTPYPYSIPPDDIPVASNRTAKDSIAAQVETFEETKPYKVTIPYETRKAKRLAADYIKNSIISNGWNELIGKEEPKLCLIEEPLPKNPLSITYYEFHKVLCDTKNVSVMPYYVDGGLNLSAKNRLCLGAVTNVLRDVSTDKVLQGIGKGVRFDMKGEGNLWISNLSAYSVFVQSSFLDNGSKRGIVHKIAPLSTYKVFDLENCYRELKRINMYKSLADAAENFSINEKRHIQESIDTDNLNKAVDIGVDDMRNICSLKVSFVKGWGEAYGRERIFECPCWIDVTVNRALQILDYILNSPNIK